MCAEQNVIRHCVLENRPSRASFFSRPPLFAARPSRCWFPCVFPSPTRSLFPRGFTHLHGSPTVLPVSSHSPHPLLVISNFPLGTSTQIAAHTYVPGCMIEMMLYNKITHSAVMIFTTVSGVGSCSSSLHPQHQGHHSKYKFSQS